MHPHDSLALKRRGYECCGRLERLLAGADPDGFECISGDALVATSRDGFNFGGFGHASGYKIGIKFSVPGSEFSVLLRIQSHMNLGTENWELILLRSRFAPPQADSVC